jgi:hypothetical protein
MHRERLEELKRLMGKVKPERLNMFSWICGTAACALGHAAKHKPFKKQGLTLTSLDGVPSPTYKAYRGIQAGECFFELSRANATYLFLAGSYAEEQVSPQHVIQHIDRLLEQSSDAS